MAQTNVFDILKERGFIKQTVFEEDLIRLLATESVSCYVGFDPTADSLHIGHYIPIMALAHMQRAGHRPIALIGGGTAMIGDPSNRTDMRSMMTKEQIAHNVACFKKQMSRFIRFEGERAAVMVNNADWLLDLNYIDFLRDIGVNFTVNKMLTAECFKTRYERGLNFLEFNYMLMQAYDFLVLHREYGCKLELGGNDQWSNMLAGADLIRRKEREDAFCMTFALLEKSDGTKMGKTAKGALWLDPEKTSPYEFYQYFRSIEDVKVRECFSLLTFVPMREIDELTKYNDERMNASKERLAYEVTRIVHGDEAADACREQARAAFGGDEARMPTIAISGDPNMSVAQMMTAVKAAPSTSEARRLIQSGAVTIGERKVTDVRAKLSDIADGTEFVLHKGKKTHVKVILK